MVLIVSVRVWTACYFDGCIEVAAVSFFNSEDFDFGEWTQAKA